MTRWQRRARLLIAVFAVVFAGFVAWQFKGRQPPPVLVAPVRTDPNAVVELTGGDFLKFGGSREDVRVKSKRQVIQADGSSTLYDMTTLFDERNGSRTFTITSKEGRVGKGESAVGWPPDP